MKIRIPLAIRADRDDRFGGGVLSEILISPEFSTVVYF